MLWSLRGGEQRPASELAMLANVSPQTASNHLRLLLDGGLVAVSSAGRNKFYRLSGPAVADALESLAAASAPTPARGVAQERAPGLVFARTCYDHLAGELAVTILDRLRERQYLLEDGRDFQLTEAGEEFFSGLGIAREELERQRRRFAYACLDWSHRVPHLGGSLGAALLDWCLRSKVVARRKDSRAIRLTETGQHRLEQLLAIRLTAAGRVAG